MSRLLFRKLVAGKYFRFSFLAIFALSQSAMAGGDSGARPISRVDVEQWGVAVSTAGNFSNPDSCGGNDRVVLLLENSRYKDIYPLVLAAGSSVKNVTFWLDGCYAVWGTTYPKVVNAWVDY